MNKYSFKYLVILFLSLCSTALFSQTQTWQWAYHAGDHGNESATSVAVDGSGNAYITGSYTSAFINFGTYSLLNNFSGSADIFLVKFDSSGTVLWAKTFGGAYGDQGNSVAVDASGNVILTGWFAGASITFGSTVLTNAGTASSDFFIAKFDPSGNLIWAKSAGGTVNDRGYSVSTDIYSNIFVIGWYSSPTINFGTGVLTNAGSATNDIFLVKYNANGTALWSKTIGGSNNDAGNACATDTLGNIYITGNFASSSINFGSGALTNAGSGTNDLFIAKYDSLGALSWSAGAGGIYDEIGNGLAVFGNNVYLTGNFSSPTIIFGNAAALTNASAGTYDVFLTSYSSTGIANWSERAGGIDSDEGKCVCTDALGNIYISGSFISTNASFGNNTLANYTAGTRDLFVASYTNTGNPIWSLEVGSYADEIGYGIASSTIGTIYLGGMFNSGSVNFGSNTIYKGCGEDVFYAKLDVPVIAVTTGIQSASLIDMPFKLFPNPSSNGIFSVSERLANAEITVYTIMGERIYSNSHFQHTIDLSSQAKGVYFVQINSKEKIYAQKIIIE